MLFFGKKAAREADQLEQQVDQIKKVNVKGFDKAERSTARLHNLLKANGISLRIYIATGGDRRGR